jgi:hypothetical protein
MDSLSVKPAILESGGTDEINKGQRKFEVVERCGREYVIRDIWRFVIERICGCSGCVCVCVCQTASVR